MLMKQKPFSLFTQTYYYISWFDFNPFFINHVCWTELKENVINLLKNLHMLWQHPSLNVHTLLLTLNNIQARLTWHTAQYTKRRWSIFGFSIQFITAYKEGGWCVKNCCSKIFIIKHVLLNIQAISMSCCLESCEWSVCVVYIWGLSFSSIHDGF